MTKKSAKAAGLVGRFVYGGDAVVLRVFKQLGREFKKEGNIVRGAKARVAEVRAILHFLHSAGIAVFKRNNDAKTGWYAYEWRLSARAQKEVFGNKRG
jgi:transcription initiation factor IIE alpha subunit